MHEINLKKILFLYFKQLSEFCIYCFKYINDEIFVRQTNFKMKGTNDQKFLNEFPASYFTVSNNVMLFSERECHKYTIDFEIKTKI